MKKGSTLLKVIGIAAIIGILIAIGRIVFRVFTSKSDSNDSHEGV